MTKLIATHTNGFVACFTEGRLGMQQRALIDIGEGDVTPQELADIANALDNRWGWTERIIKSGATPKALEGSQRKRTYTPRDDTDTPPKEREQLVLTYLPEHPDSSVREIMIGSGIDDSDAKRVGRWTNTMYGLLQAGIVISRIDYKGNKGGRFNRYSLSGSTNGQD